MNAPKPDVLPPIHAEDAQLSLETDAPYEKQRPSSVHPLADLFPMLQGDDLAALADDIRVNGLLHPILVDADDQLIDGRNRLAACRIAGVEPRFARIDGDAEAIIWSANVQRRQMSKGAIAMVGAMGNSVNNNRILTILRPGESVPPNAVLA